MRISARKRSKSAVKRPVFAFRELEGVRNRKKVAKKSEFLFLQGADRPSGADPAKDAWRRSGVGFAKDAWSLVAARGKSRKRRTELSGDKGQVPRKEEMSPAMAKGGSCIITRSPAAAGETPAKISEEPSGGNGADYAQDTRYRSDGDEASFRERGK